MAIVRNVDICAITIVTRRRPATQNASLTFSSELAAAETTTCLRSTVVSRRHFSDYSLNVFHQHSQFSVMFLGVVIYEHYVIHCAQFHCVIVVIVII